MWVCLQAYEALLEQVPLSNAQTRDCLSGNLCMTAKVLIETRAWTGNSHNSTGGEVTVCKYGFGGVQMAHQGGSLMLHSDPAMSQSTHLRVASQPDGLRMAKVGKPLSPTNLAHRLVGERWCICNAQLMLMCRFVDHTSIGQFVTPEYSQALDNS